MGRDVPFLLPEICQYPPERYPAGFQCAVFAQPVRSALYNEETGSGYAMDFDGDLPSDAAMPGDIVIYNGTVTKAGRGKPAVAGAG